MTEKEESTAPVQFFEEWALVMEAEGTLSSRFSKVYIDHIDLSELQVLELQDEEKAKNLLRYLANMRLKMMEDLTPVDEAKFTLDLSVKKNVSYI